MPPYNTHLDALEDYVFRVHILPCILYTVFNKYLVNEITISFLYCYAFLPFLLIHTIRKLAVDIKCYVWLVLSKSSISRVIKRKTESHRSV